MTFHYLVETRHRPRTCEGVKERWREERKHPAAWNASNRTSLACEFSPINSLPPLMFILSHWCSDSYLAVAAIVERANELITTRT